MALLYTRTRAFRRPPPIPAMRRAGVGVGTQTQARLQAGVAAAAMGPVMYNLRPGASASSSPFQKNVANIARETKDAEFYNKQQGVGQFAVNMDGEFPRPTGANTIYDDTIIAPPTGVSLPPYHYILNATPYAWTAPADQASHPYKEHQGEGSQYLRDFILGVNDGLISSLLLVVGLVGGGSASRVVLLSAISGAIAGAISMGLGEFVATKSQNDVVVGEVALEQEHFKYHRDKEVDELRGFLSGIGLDGPLLEAAVRKVGGSDESLMTVMTKFEFGGEANEELGRSPITSMLMSGRLFLIGSLPSVLPFVQNNATLGLILALVFSSLGLIFVGAYKTRTTGGNPYRSAAENFGLGAVGAGISFVIGLLYTMARGG